MCKRPNTSASRALFWSNTKHFFIDAQTAQYIRKSGAILNQHYNTLFLDVQTAQYIRKSGAVLKQHYNTFFARSKTAWVLEGRHAFWYVKHNDLKASRAHYARDPK